MISDLAAKARQIILNGEYKTLADLARQIGCSREYARLLHKAICEELRHASEHTGEPLPAACERIYRPGMGYGGGLTPLADGEKPVSLSVWLDPQILKELDHRPGSFSVKMRRAIALLIQTGPQEIARTHPQNLAEAKSKGFQVDPSTYAQLQKIPGSMSDKIRVAISLFLAQQQA